MAAKDKEKIKASLGDRMASFLAATPHDSGPATFQITLDGKTMPYGQAELGAAILLPAQASSEVNDETHKSTRRLRKVWAYVAVLFVLISVLAYIMTGNFNTLSVVGVVCVALGLLGSLMAVVSVPRRSMSQPV